MTRLFTIHDVDEETPVQFLGVHPFRWKPEWGEPQAMFVEVDDPVYDAVLKYYPPRSSDQTINELIGGG